MQKSETGKFAACYNRVFFLMLAGCVFYLLALPPTELWYLGWVVAAFWTPLIRRKTLLNKAFPPEKENQAPAKHQKKPFWAVSWVKNRFKNHPYRQIWLAGVIFWGITVHWVCFPHWATCFGWFALICYLSLYFPLFVFFARTVHHTPVLGHNIPVWLAAPMSWLTVSYLKGTLMGGFGFALLEHTQYKQTALIQLADIGGESLVGAVMIFVGVLFGYCFPVVWALEKNLPENDAQSETYPKLSCRTACFCLGTIIFSFVLIIGYGKYRDAQYLPPEKPLLQAAVLQGNYRASLSAPPGWYDEVFANYKKMALKAVEQYGTEIDLIVWPESTCIYPWVDVDQAELLPENQGKYSEEQWGIILSNENEEICNLSRTIGKPCLLGVASYVYSERKNGNFQYNSALLIENVHQSGYDSSGVQRSEWHFQRYDKMLLVMFGEYLPLTNLLPKEFFLRTLCQRADFGRQPVSFKISRKSEKEGNPDDATCQASANICFESSSSKLVRAQLLVLGDQGISPDLLMNISNDGWFRHSSQIDMHLATHVFRAIENRKPYLIATNGGFSGGIDGNGKILSIGKRNSNQIVFVKLFADPRSACYFRIGSFFSLFALAFMTLFLIYTVWRRVACSRS